MTSLLAFTFALLVDDGINYKHKETGIEIFCGVRDTMFPESWRKDPINGKATPVPSTEVVRSLDLISKAFSYYPPELLKSKLKTVYVSRTIEFYGLSYGGTNSEDCIYITNGGLIEGFSDQYVEQTIHHEFSSIILREYWNSFPYDVWMNSLPKGFKYRGDGVQSLREGTSDTNQKDEFVRDGFISQYSTSSIEEDFNMLAQNLFMGSPKFWKAYDEYPMLKKKTDLVISVYKGASPRFTKSWFRKQVRVDSGQNQSKFPIHAR